MFFTLVKAQIMENLYGVKFVVTFIVCLILMIAGTISGVGRYEQQIRDQANIIASNEGTLRESGSWWGAARTGQKVVKPATHLVIFSSGLEASVGRTATVKEGDFPQMEDSIYSTAPIFAVFGDMDLTFIIKIVISLFAILFTYDLISGEKERGTLKLCLSNSVPRNVYVLAKSLGSFVSMLIPLVIPLTISLLVSMFVGGFDFTGEEWLRLTIIIVGYVLYMLSFFSIGLAVSAMTKRSAYSFLILLFLWVLIVLILPKGAMLLAGQIHPIPTVNEVRAEQLKLNMDFRNTLWERTMEEANKQLGQVSFGDQESRYKIFEIRNKLRDELEPEYQKKNERLVDDFKKNQNNLTELAINISRFSPASAVTYIGMNMAGTGYPEQENFLKQLTNHRETFTKFIETQIEEERKSGNFRHGPTSQGELDISKFPKMKYHRLAIETDFALVLPDLTSLLLVSIIFYLIGFVMFLRYDVR